MLTVPAALAIAASFWGSHGYVEAQPVAWNLAEHRANVQGSAVYGSYVISLNRRWWRFATDEERCRVVIHEVGHAAFSFEHVEGTVMSKYDDPDTRPTPGACKAPGLARSRS